MKRIVSSLFAFAAALVASATTTLQNDTLTPGAQDLKIAADDPAILAIDRVLTANYLNHFCFSADSKVLNAYGYSAEQVPTFSPEITAERLKIIDKETPFDLVYNGTVQGFIDLYAIRRRDITTKVLGMSQLYFPMFEEALAKHGIPQEMKYLAVIESALNPSAISPAGAGGLWQFMVATGKMYGLEVNSYQDDRFDPIKSTEAACKYLKFLYNTFGDWQLALAAYNSGPGNVNKAIRRAGGKRDFWEIKNFLPKETQGYVPAFIAVNYVMNYSAEHNLYAKQPIATYFEVDTLVVNERIEFNALSRVIGMSVEEIAFLNPTYKLKEIPDNGRKHYIYLPVEKTGLFIANEDLVYEQSRVRIAEPEPVVAANTPAAASNASANDNAVKKTIWENQWKTHSVRRGESLGKIADKYDVSLAELKKWNKIKGSKVVPGQKLKVQTRVKKTILVENTDENVAQTKTESGEVTAQQEEERSPDAIAAAEQEKNEKPATPKASAPKYKYYTVQPGDTLWKIANKHDGVSMDQIKTLNKGLKENKLAVGQKIKIKQIN